MINAESLSRLLQILYAAPLEAAAWPEFLKQLTELLPGISGAAILYHALDDKNHGFYASAGIDPEQMKLYQEYYGTRDVWLAPFLKRKEGEIAFGPELCSPEELVRTEYYNDFLI